VNSAKNLPDYAKKIQDRFNTFRQHALSLQPTERNAGKHHDEIDFAGVCATAGAVGESLLGLVTYLPWFVLIPILAFFLSRTLIFFASLVARYAARRLANESRSDTGFNKTLVAYARAQLPACLSGRSAPPVLSHRFELRGSALGTWRNNFILADRNC